MRIEIQPVTVFPDDANFLFVRPNWNTEQPPPVFYWELQKVTPGTKHKAKPAVGEPGDPDYREAVAAFQDPETVAMLKNGFSPMTSAQWKDWIDQPDDEYILNCTVENLGLKPA